MKEPIEAKSIENREWIDSLDWVIRNEKPGRVNELFRILRQYAQGQGVEITNLLNTDYVNTIPPEQEADYPGDEAMEEKLIAAIRWNAMAMVNKANRLNEGIGGHISTYASAATLFEVGFNHFFKGPEDGLPDLVFYQGHASPGVYARSYVEYRLTDEHLDHFRLEIQHKDGLSSYPHPRLMPGYWSFPTVSMGLAPIQAIYQARFIRYLEDRNLKDASGQHVWALLGDGEMDEPEALGAITVAGREQLNNLTFVINCNLQRLDGPVRGNAKIIQELEAVFTGAGWNVIKVVWSREWDTLFEKDDGELVKALNSLVDGELQKFAASGGAHFREHFFGQSKSLQSLVSDWSDDDLENLKRGGHDPRKIFNAYKLAVESKDAPTVILAQTVKGYGQGEAGEALNVTHKQKKLDKKELIYFRDRINIPLEDDELGDVPYFRYGKNSEEHKYLLSQRQQLGGLIPHRVPRKFDFSEPGHEIFEEFFKSSGDREVTTTMVLVQILSKLLKDETWGKYVVPVIPDESRTFGMDSLFHEAGIYAHSGQKYEPVDKGNLLYYRESEKGALIEEGITEAGSLSTFIAAGTSYVNHNLPMLPFFVFYSMFGFQRIGDLIWAACDARARGFLIGGIAGRTTLSGEGLQHQDGHSHLNALAFPGLKAYDPAFAFEVAVIIREGMRRMYSENEDLIYYITVMNDAYPMPEMPDHSKDDLLNGIYRFSRHEQEDGQSKVHLLGSGAVMTDVLKAADLLHTRYNLSVDIWSVTSYKQLYDDCRDTDRWRRLYGSSSDRKSHLEKKMEDENGIFIAASDYIRVIPLSIAQYLPGPLTVLGTDGFGRSDTIPALRRFFEVDASHIAYAALSSLAEEGLFKNEALEKARNDLGIDPEKINPADPMN